MKRVIDRLVLLLAGGTAALSDLRKRFTAPRPDAIEARLEAIERAMEIQATLNEAVDVRVKLIYALLEKARKKLQVVTIVLIATATVAALALTAALLR